MQVFVFVLLFALSPFLAYAESMRGSVFMSNPNASKPPARELYFKNAPRHRLDIHTKRASLLDPPKKINRNHQPRTVVRRHDRISDVMLIRSLIQEAESRHRGYDAIQHGARIKPGKRPTQMTIGEIFHWIDRTPGQPHAIGRYQFIPSTLRRLVKKVNAKKSQRFSPALQDRLADVLLVEAGLHKFRSGTLHRHQFMNNLAAIWAGLPNSTGRSHYHGHAGNKAAISWARFDSVMSRISPNVIR